MKKRRGILDALNTTHFTNNYLGQIQEGLGFSYSDGVPLSKDRFTSPMPEVAQIWDRASDSNPGTNLMR
ncbi:MAG: hypothetical protein QGI37_13335, partial [Verrucomicrobiota bacterium]|nr:hypothetical protein [Verrucomicrobiota bacterium]